MKKEEYKEKFIAKIINLGMDIESANIEYNSFTFENSEAIKDGEPEFDAEECFSYYAP